MKLNVFISLIVGGAALLQTIVPVDASEIDYSIESSARQTYIFRVFLQDDEIKIEANEGIVKLTGIVSDEFKKELTQETVTSLPDVVSVDNRLDIKGALPTLNSDAWIHDKVKFALMVHRNVDAGTTEVDVRDGIVTLRGTASSQPKKELTAVYAKDVEGVKDVINEITVISGSRKVIEMDEDIDDASITAQVKLTLLYHRSTHNIKTSITTDKGTVTLHGKARSKAEVDLITELVSDINGVTEVNNQIVVE